MPTPAMPPVSFPPASGDIFLARVYWLSTFLLLAAFAAVFAAVVTRADTNLPEAWWLLFATASTLAALARQLPVQNVLLAAVITASIGGLAHLFGVKSGIPFGSFMFGPEAGFKLFGTLPWMIPLLWIVVVFNSRGVARLILRPWRKMRAYGFWLMGLTALFTMLFDCALEPFATTAKHFWIWTAGGFSLLPQGPPISNSVGWFIIALLILAFVTPTLINKQLSKRSAPDFHPLYVWLGAILLFGTSSAMRGLWLAVTVDVVIAAVITVFAIRGAKW